MKFLAFGEILWDVFPQGAHLGGAALNFAAHCALLGVDSHLVSAVGRDDYGDKALAELGEYGVKTELCARLSHLPTGSCQVSFGENGLPRYCLVEPVAYDEIPVPESGGEGFDLLYFGTLALRREYNRASLAALLKKHGGKVFCDLNIRPPHYSPEVIRFALENASIIKISDEEMPLVARSVLGSATTPEKDLIRLSEHFSVPELYLLTKGGDGAEAFLPESGERFLCSAVKTEVVSTVGAGDSFSAAFLTHYLTGESIPDSLRSAAKLAAFVVSRTEAVPR